MKKTFQYIFLFAIACFILIILPSQVKSPSPPKELTVTLTLEQWQVVLDAIDKSNAGHLQVKNVQEMIVPQLQKQLADTTKKK